MKNKLEIPRKQKLEIGIKQNSLYRNRASNKHNKKEKNFILWKFNSCQNPE